MRVQFGLALSELLAALFVVSLVLTVSLPALAEFGSRAAANAGARRLSLVLHDLRWRSIASGRGHGLLFTLDAQGWSWCEVADGNGNGLRMGDVRNGTDPRIGGPLRLEAGTRGARLGFPPLTAVREIPPRRGWIANLDDPIRIGNTALLAFGPLGTSTSGTLFVTDAKRSLLAIVLSGAGGRVRVWSYDAARQQWKM